MIKVTYEKYYCDYLKKFFNQSYNSIDGFIWDFKNEYKNRVRQNGTYSLGDKYLRLRNIYNQEMGFNGSLWVIKVEDDNNIYFEDGKYIAPKLLEKIKNSFKEFETKKEYADLE